MTILYCDCFSGISGDMFLGALVDAGLPVEYLVKQFQCLNLPEFIGVRSEKVCKGTLAATQVRLEIHDHDEDHDRPHHRRLSDIRSLIESSSLPAGVQQTSLKIFQMLAKAEAKVHAVGVEEVHFHEVGAVDSILDIVGTAVGLDFFNVQSVYSSSLPLGSGQVNTQHGVLPLPAPATMELIQMAHAPITPSKSVVELVTPTGAAILAALAAFQQPDMIVNQVGIGAGQRDLEWPNILRVVIGEPVEEPGTHLEIETNIDDMNPQIFGHVMTKLFQAGALDVYFTPIFMKKNRPATKLSVIALKKDELRICDVILRETSTLGVRVKSIWRHEAERELLNIETCYGQVPLKLKVIDGEIVQAVPEFDVCIHLASENNTTVFQIIKEVEALAFSRFQKNI